MRFSAKVPSSTPSISRGDATFVIPNTAYARRRTYAFNQYTTVTHEEILQMLLSHTSVRRKYNENSNSPTMQNKRIFSESVGRQLCKFKIGSDFVQNSILNCDYLIIQIRKPSIQTRANSGIIIRGFATAYAKLFPGTLYLDLLCSPDKAGALILEETENLAVQLKLPLLKLSALPEVIGFYRKKGYRHKDNACKRERELKVGTNTHGYRMTKCMKV